MTAGRANLIRTEPAGVDTMLADLDLGGGRSAGFSEAEGLLSVRDRALFRPGFEGFSRRLAGAAIGLGGVRSAFVCLASGTCQLEFEGGRFAASEMALWFAEAVKAATDPGRSGADDGPGDWISLRVDSTADTGASWETTYEGRGSFRLRHRDLKGDRALARRVAGELAEAPGVTACRVTSWGGDLDVHLDREGPGPAEVLAIAAGAYRRVLQPVPQRFEGEPEAGAPEVATGLKRVGLLALAGGSFGLTIVGLAIPGVPTVPFLLATSYFLVRSSPALNERLLRSSFFGPILSDLEFGHGLRQINKVKLMVFTLTVGLVTVIVMAPAWPILVVMLLVTSAGLIAIARIPAITDQSEPAQTPRLKLLTA